MKTGYSEETCSECGHTGEGRFEYDDVAGVTAWTCPACGTVQDPEGGV